MMEDELGGGRPTTAGDLAGLLTGGAAAVVRVGVPDRHRRRRHRSSAARRRPQGRLRPVRRGLVAHSLATALVAAGFPAVIGWDGSVDDRAATAFAERLYRALADRADLAVAVGDARRVLLESDDPVVRADWHLARLWLGPAGGGPLVAGSRKRSLVPGHPRHQDVPGPQAAGAGRGGGDVRGPAPGAAAGAAGAALGGPGRGAAARAGPAGQVQPGRPDRRPVPGHGGGGGVRRLRGAGHPGRGRGGGAGEPGGPAADRGTAAGGAAAARGGRGGAGGSADRAVRPGRRRRAAAAAAGHR